MMLWMLLQTMWSMLLYMMLWMLLQTMWSMLLHIYDAVDAVTNYVVNAAILYMMLWMLLKNG